MTYFAMCYVGSIRLAADKCVSAGTAAVAMLNFLNRRKDQGMAWGCVVECHDQGDGLPGPSVTIPAESLCTINNVQQWFDTHEYTRSYPSAPLTLGHYRAAYLRYKDSLQAAQKGVMTEEEAAKSFDKNV